MKTKEEKKVEPKVEQTLYTITLTLGDKTIEGSGETALEAIRAIPVPVKIFTKGILKITDGVKKAEQVLIVPRVRRLFYPLMQPIIAKQLSNLMH